MFDVIGFYRKASKSDRATILLFSVFFLEIGLAYSRLLKVDLLSDISDYISALIPAFGLAQTKEAKAYMLLTTILSPLKIWLGYLAEWEGKSFADLIRLPSREEEISMRMIVSIGAVLLFMGGTVYFCFGYGVITHWHSTFLSTPYDPFKTWWGWAVYRLIPFCFSSSLFILSLRTYAARFERKAR